MPRIKNIKIPVNATKSTPQSIASPNPQPMPNIITHIPAIPKVKWPTTGLSYRKKTNKQNNTIKINATLNKGKSPIVLNRMASSRVLAVK